MTMDVSTPPLTNIHSMTEAINLTVKGSGIPAKVLAARLGIQYEHFMRMLNRDDRSNFPPDLIKALCIECQNNLPARWLSWSLGEVTVAKSVADSLEAIKAALSAEGRTPMYSMRNSRNEDFED